jgi:hypothetical protein
MKLATWGLGITLAAAPAMAAAQQEISRPDWVRRPSALQMLEVLPRGLARAHSGGKATIECEVTVQGALRGCRVAAEDPPGKGFGDAALLLAPYFQLRPAMKGGKPVEGKVRLPMRWQGDFVGVAPSGDAPIGSLIPPKPNSNRVVGRLKWREAPSVADIAAAYPAKAKAANAGGRAVLDCVIDRDGGLGACRTEAETPINYGFAAAARALAGKFVAPTESSTGESLVGAHTQVMFTFDPATLSEANPVIGKPDWAALPSGADFAQAFPPKAKQEGVLQARVMLVCTVAAGGELSDCTAESEDPPGYGFGEATVRLAEKFRVNVWTAEGLPTIGGALRIPLRYDLRAPAGK